jgi:hypothetical protein
MTDTPPNPGSQAAIDAGCECAVLDNCHGRGFPWPRTDGRDPNAFPSFYVNASCPMHGGGTVDANEEVTDEAQ